MCVPAGGVAAICPVTDANAAPVRRRRPRPADYLTHRPDAQSVEHDEIESHGDAEHKSELDTGQVQQPLQTRSGDPGRATDHDCADAREDQCIDHRRGESPTHFCASQRFHGRRWVHLIGDRRPEPLERRLRCAVSHGGQWIFRARQEFDDGTERLFRRKPDGACKSAHVRASVDTCGQFLEATFVDSGRHGGIQSGGRADVRQGDALFHTRTVKFEPIGHGEPPYPAIGRCRRLD